MTTHRAPFSVYLRRDDMLCQRVLVTDDATYASDFLNGAIRSAETSGGRLEGWIEASPDPTTRICTEVLFASTTVPPRRPEVGK